MSKDRLVSSSTEAKASIDRYERQLAKSADLQAIMSYARSWHGYLNADGRWRVAPSKFAGYAENDAAAYVRLHRQRDGRRSERVLSAWFDAVEPGSASYEDMTTAVLGLFAKYGRAPNKLLRVSAGRSDRNLLTPGMPGEKLDRALFRSRITFDAGICGGRPTIRSMRIRVSDVLDMLAAGATREEILTDYPYLEDEDIRAALEYAAETATHRVVSAA